MKISNKFLEKNRSGTGTLTWPGNWSENWIGIGTRTGILE